MGYCPGSSEINFRMRMFEISQAITKQRRNKTMAKKAMLGPTMLRVFEEEVRNLFGTLINQATEMEAAIDREVDVLARKDLGIFDLSVEIAKTEVHLKELKRQLEEYTTRKHLGGSWTSLLEVKKEEVKRRLMGDSVAEKIRAEMKRIVREVRIASLGEDIAQILRVEVPKTVALLTDEVAKLPQPTLKELPVFEDD